MVRCKELHVDVKKKISRKTDQRLSIGIQVAQSDSNAVHSGSSEV
jgi:hypothetical protein